MINVSSELKKLLESRSCEILIGVEFYDRTVDDISSIAAPKNAIARFSDTCFTWNNSTGSYDYDAKITDFPSIKTYLDDRINEASITLGNVARGEKSGANFVLSTKIKGCWLVIRLIFPDIPDESWVIWWGKCLRPGKIDNKSVEISATQEIGNYNSKIPFRSYGTKCPLVPGKGDCLGPVPLKDHTPLYQQQYAEYGTMLCPDRTRETCVKLGNEKHFQGQPTVAISGTFSYVPKDDADILNKNKKSKLSNLKTESWSSVNQSDGSSDIVPIGFGRFQLAGHPIVWADTGLTIRSILGFCEGKVSAFDFIRCRNKDFQLASVIPHYGEYGGVGSQVPDVLFNGFTGYNSRLAYLEVSVTGSDNETTDSVPLITAVVRGMEIPVPNENGEYVLSESTSNPVHIVRFILTDDKYGKIPPARIADIKNLRTSAICDELVEDRSQSEWLLLPSNEANGYNDTYRRYRSSGAWTAYREMVEFDAIHGSNFAIPIGSEELLPIFEHPFVQWYNPFGSPPLLDKRNILRQRFTINGALQERTSILDFLTKRILPCFRGWLNYNRDGQIEIRTREPADNAYLRSYVKKDNTFLPVTNIKKWLEDTSGYLVIGVGLESSEVRKVKSVAYSPGCNGLPINITTTGSVSATVFPISGGSFSNRGVGYIELSGEVTAGSEVKMQFNSVPNDFYISYVSDGVENLSGMATMIMKYLNANPDFSNYLTAYISPTTPNRINIQCEAGFLELDKPLEFDHDISEEIMRVCAVFENCNEVTADTSSSFDNIYIDSFSWNENSDNDDINAYSAIYTSAIDDFHVAKIIPRTNWDTIDLEGELNEEELDLKFIDNYWQAAYVTKSYAIENIDGNIQFSWKTGVSGFTLEMGDVVAVRHDSGDGVIRYTPVWISSINYDLKNLSTDITARLYLSGAWDHRVQAVDQTLTTTLNPDYVPYMPDSLGTTGGYGTASVQGSPGYARFLYFRDSRYSVDGTDMI